MNYPPSYGTPPGRPDNGLGLAAMILGIVGLVLFFTVIIGFVCGVLAIIFGVIGRRRARQGLATNNGQATAGLVTGILAVVVPVVVVAALILPGGGGNGCFHLGTGPDPCASN
ncbi:MAG: DUF4190 domain-containing protein [Frankiaceae bacterium]|nr:DUF4190 domain-containing protein [Frankiaceae bacterium]MBV9369226.1 DUF4190 domain-containing protein [Frankiales bacterium]